VLNLLLEEVLFEAPEAGARDIQITAEMVERRLGGISRDRDLSRYIL
jgi:ATP-dependent HslUV protease ATP-binding subunit HslU